MVPSTAAPVWERDENIPNFVGSIETARQYLIELGERAPDESVKTAMDRAAKRAGLSHSRTFDLWYRKARRIEDFECDQISAAIRKRRRDIARNEFHDLRTRMARLEAMLAMSDPEFHRDNLQGLRSSRGE